MKISKNVYMNKHNGYTNVRKVEPSDFEFIRKVSCHCVSQETRGQDIY
jgi:hypothetical protein